MSFEKYSLRRTLFHCFCDDQLPESIPGTLRILRTDYLVAYASPTARRLFCSCGGFIDEANALAAEHEALESGRSPVPNETTDSLARKKDIWLSWAGIMSVLAGEEIFRENPNLAGYPDICFKVRSDGAVVAPRPLSGRSPLFPDPESLSRRVFARIIAIFTDPCESDYHGPPPTRTRTSETVVGVCGGDELVKLLYGLSCELDNAKTHLFADVPHCQREETVWLMSQPPLKMVCLTEQFNRLDAQSVVINALLSLLLEESFPKSRDYTDSALSQDWEVLCWNEKKELERDEPPTGTSLLGETERSRILDAVFCAPTFSAK